MARYEVTFESQFSAKHALRHYRGRTEPTHGHRFRVVVVVSAPRVGRAGMAIDFLDLKERVNAETTRLRGTFLNDAVSEFREGHLSPSAENIAATLFRRIRKGLPTAVRMESVTVSEAPGCSATYRS